MLLLGSSFWDPSLELSFGLLLAHLGPKRSQRVPKEVLKWFQNGVQTQTLILGQKWGGRHMAPATEVRPHRQSKASQK